MDSIRSLQTPSSLSTSIGGTKTTTAAESSSIVTRSMSKNLGSRVGDGSTPLSSLPTATSKGEKRKRSVTVKKEPSVEEKQAAAKKSCVLCEDELASVTFWPCRHQACCFDCSLRLKKCPKCKRAISKKEREDGETIEPLDKQTLVSYTELLSKVRELEENQLCSICMVSKKRVVFNCGHMACQSCSNSLHICHYCRSEIRTRTRIFEV